MAADIILNENDISLTGMKVSVQRSVKVGLDIRIGGSEKRTLIKNDGILTGFVSAGRGGLKGNLRSIEADIGVLNILPRVNEVDTLATINIGEGTARTVLTEERIKCKKIRSDDIRARRITELSDARCKQDVNVISNSLDKIMNLQGVSFNWEENELTGTNPPKEKQLGFIAQDVEKVLPEVVKQDGEGRHSIAYTSVIPLLVEGMKTQQKNIQLQSEEIESKSRENQALQKRITEIETKLNSLLNT